MKLFIADFCKKILFNKIPGHTFLLGIDGCGGAGKSTLAQGFKEVGDTKVTVKFG